MFISETWLHCEVPNGLLDPCAKYSIIRKDRKTGKGGGVCVFVSNQCKFAPVTIDTKFDDTEIVSFDCIGSRNGIRFFNDIRTGHPHMTALLLV